MKKTDAGNLGRVAPHVGAWIETSATVATGEPVVAPLAGAWIETEVREVGMTTASGRRAPRGRVD